MKKIFLIASLSGVCFFVSAQNTTEPAIISAPVSNQSTEQLENKAVVKDSPARQNDIKSYKDSEKSKQTPSSEVKTQPVKRVNATEPGKSPEQGNVTPSTPQNTVTGKSCSKTCTKTCSGSKEKSETSPVQ